MFFCIRLSLFDNSFVIKFDSNLESNSALAINGVLNLSYTSCIIEMDNNRYLYIPADGAARVATVLDDAGAASFCS